MFALPQNGPQGLRLLPDSLSAFFVDRLLRCTLDVVVPESKFPTKDAHSLQVGGHKLRVEGSTVL